MTGHGGLLLAAGATGAAGAVLYGVATAMLAAISAPETIADAEAFVATVDRLAYVTALGLGLLLAGLALVPPALRADMRIPPALSVATVIAFVAAGLVVVARWAATGRTTFSASWSTWATVEGFAWILYAFGLMAALALARARRIAAPE